MDLLDRLFCSQILVHFLYQEHEVEWLDRISVRVNAAVELRIGIGAEAERLKHLVLCLLEIYLADDIDQLGEKLNVKLPQAPLQITPEVISKSMGYRRDFFAGEVLAFNTRPGLDGLAVGIVNELLSEFTSAPASVRYRLVERILAWEFPDAPITVFAWLAKMGVVKPAKYSGRNVASLIDAAVLRAASLSEFEMIRAGFCASIGRGLDSNWPRLLLMNLADNLTSEAKSRLIDGMQAEERRQTQPGLATRGRVLLESRLLDAPYLRAFFADCESMAPYVRKAIHKQSMALTDIAAAMIAIRINKDRTRAIYVELGESSIAHDVKRALNEHGFEVNARSIYRHYRQNLMIHADSMLGYYRRIASADAAFSAEYGDIYHWYQVALNH